MQTGQNVPKALATQRLWRALSSVCEQAGDDGCSTDDMAYVLQEFALGVAALTFNKEELMAFLANRLAQIGRNEQATVNAIMGTIPKLGKESSTVEVMAKLGDAHPKLKAAHRQCLLDLKKFSDE